LNKPISAYSGTEPFAFVCYSHADSDTVYSDLIELDSHGVKLWYDEGISAGSSWRAGIAHAIQGANQFIFFISTESLKSSHCLREVDYALSHDKEIIPIYLEECQLPAELDLVLNRVHALFKWKDTKYMEHLLEALQGNKPAGVPVHTATATKSPRKRFVLLGILAALLLVIAVFWGQSTFISSNRPGEISTSSANENYITALALVQRWDKGNNLETAIGLFREATEMNPEFALAYARLADAMRMQFAITREEPWLEEAIIQVDEAARLNPGLATVQVAMGKIHAAQGNYDLAFAALEQALSIDPNDPEAHQAIAKVYERQGRLEDADASFRKALALDPENLLILNSYSSFLSRQGRHEEAIERLNVVIQTAPDHYGALVNMGAALSELNRNAEAIVMYENALEIKPTYMGYSNLGTALAREKRYPEAVVAINKALELDDSGSLAWGNLAFVYSWMDGMEKQASDTFEHAIELAEASRQKNPRDPYTHSDLALYYAKQGQPDLATQRLETAMALSPESAETLATAAEVYEHLGQRDKAVELANRSMELGMTRQRLEYSPDLVELLADPRMQGSP
jgi:tetratricopeptide (TPR) repeat protein